MFLPESLKRRFIEEDTLAYMNNAVVTTSEWEHYGIELTQSDSASNTIPESTTYGSCSLDSSFKVAVIDSAVQINHADLPCDTQKGGPNCIGRPFGNTDSTKNPSWYDPKDAWHGTHVMGIMAAKGGSINPTLNNMCWIVSRVFDDASGDQGALLSAVYAGVVWAVKEKAKVINMSLSAGYTETGERVMQFAKDNGAIVVAGAGNSNTFQYEYPSSYDYEKYNVLSVAAVDSEEYVFGVVSSVKGWTVEGERTPIIHMQIVSHTYSLYFFLH
jgi:thermitase